MFQMNCAYMYLIIYSFFAQQINPSLMTREPELFLRGHPSVVMELCHRAEYLNHHLRKSQPTRSPSPKHGRWQSQGSRGMINIVFPSHSNMRHPTLTACDPAHSYFAIHQQVETKQFWWSVLVRDTSGTQVSKLPLARCGGFSYPPCSVFRVT